MYTAKNRTQFSICSPTPTPALLHACKESFAFMESQGWVHALGSPISRHVCINFRLDTLYLKSSAEYYNDVFRDVLNYFDRTDLRRVEKLALPWSDSYWIYATALYLSAAAVSAQDCKGIKSCACVVYDAESDRRNMRLEFLGKPIRVPELAAYSVAELDALGVIYGLPDGELSYSGIVKRLYKTLHYIREEELISGRPDWKIPDVRLGIMVNASTLTYEVQAQSEECDDDCPNPCDGECGRFKLLNLPD